MSKSFVSKESFFLFFLFLYNSWACSKNISFLAPLKAIFPSRSNFLFEFFLTQASIRQLPGPISLLISPEKSLISLIIVILDMPPILRKQIGNLILF